MKKLFYLMGKSGSGKDSLFKELIKDKELKPYILYTTRPARNGEVNKKDYNFITKDELDKFEEDDLVMEVRHYKVACGDIWSYATIYDDQFNTDNDLITIGTLESYNSLKLNENSNYEIIPIYITVNDIDRKVRAYLRESKEENPNYDEIDRRFQADEIDFSNENLYDSNIVDWFTNDNLNDCLEEIKDYIDLKKENVKKKIYKIVKYNFKNLN